MLSRADIDSENKQNNNAGNSGDLVKHTAYLALLAELSKQSPWSERIDVVEAHGGKGIYASSSRHLAEARANASYTGSTLGQAQTRMLRAEPEGLGTISGLGDAEVPYVGSAVLHAAALASVPQRSLTLMDRDSGVRATLAKVFAQLALETASRSFVVMDPKGESEPVVLDDLRGGRMNESHVLHLDPFAFVMAEEDARMRKTYGELVTECATRVKAGTLGAASVFFTWGSNGAAAKADLEGSGYLKGLVDGYQQLVARVRSENRVVVKWCWEFYFALLLIVPAGIVSPLSARLRTDLAWASTHLKSLSIA